jgi:hypothetical protein
MPRSRALLRAAVLAALLGAAASIGAADNTDQNNSGSKYAWGENVGWISARPTGEAYGPGGSGMQVSDTDVTGYLWGENIGWINLSCVNDTTCGGTAGAWGVKNDGAGNLSGYAWAENAGWISFSCQNNATTCAGNGNYGVKIPNYTDIRMHSKAGVLSGYAWGENIGWISFSCSNQNTCGTVTYHVQTGAPDSDGDGCRDSAEPGLGLDQWDQWDFYSVPVPALIVAASPTTDFRDSAVSAGDAQAVFQYFKAFAKTGTAEYEQDLNQNGIKDGIEYDRTSLGSAASGPPDGVVSAQDAQLAFSEFAANFHC